jgi:integration host factor subunit beta
MTRSELVAKLATRTSTLTQPDIAECVGRILDAIAGHLATGGRIEIRGFGTFSMHQRAARTGRNPKLGDLVAVPAKAVVRFKPGAELRQRVDGAADGAR